MGKFINIAGLRFGQLVALRATEERRDGSVVWLCQCDCGNSATVNCKSLRSGNTRSCGCKEGWHRHGYGGTHLYKVWNSMRQRCNNPNIQHFKHYGGRGIRVCERWNDFSNFLADVGECPPGLTLDRIDNDGNYEPGNVRWATRKEQAKNRRPRKSFRQQRSRHTLKK